MTRLRNQGPYMITPTGYKFHHVIKKHNLCNLKLIWCVIHRSISINPSSAFPTEQHTAERKPVFVTLSQMYRSLIAKPVLSPADNAAFL